MTDPGGVVETAGPLPSLRASVSWTFAGNIVFSACQWLMLTVLAKLATPAVVGQYALALAVTAPVVMFTNLQLRAVLATDVRGRHRFGTFVRLRLASIVVAVAVMAGIAIWSGYGAALQLLILIVGLSKCVEALSDLVYGRLQQDEQMDRIAKSMIWRGVLSLIAFAAAMLVTGSLIVAALGIVVAWIAVLFAFDLRSLRAVGGAPDTRSTWPDAMQLARLALPLGVTMMLVSLNVNVPRYFIEGSIGVDALGIFAALSAPMVAGLLVVNAVGQAATARLARHAAAGEHAELHRLLGRLAGIGAILGIGGIVVALVAGGPVLRLLFGAQYAEYTRLFAWLNVVSGLGYVASFMGFGMTALHEFRAQVPLFVLATGTTALVSWLAVPRYGLEGAALALGASAVVQLVGSIVVIERRLARR